MPLLRVRNVEHGVVTTIRSGVGAPRFPAGTGRVDGRGPMPAGPYNLTARDPGRITWTNTRLIRAIRVAYDVRSDKIDGSEQLGTDTYNIQANVPAGTTVAQFRAMVQNLLAERFRLRVHRETRQVSGYVLQIAKGGLKLRASKVPAAAGEAKPTAGSSTLIVVDESGYPATRRAIRGRVCLMPLKRNSG
jgi:uncharacterized protein (TIGR03435 family)